jgi:hypothetical protein
VNDSEDDLEDEEESDLKKLPPATPPEEAETELRFHVNDNNTSSDKAMILVTCFLEKPIV